MQEHVTLLGPVGTPRARKNLSWTLPPDLMEQVRGRVRLLALLLFIAFGFDPLVYFGIWLIVTIAGFPLGDPECPSMDRGSRSSMVATHQPA